MVIFHSYVKLPGGNYVGLKLKLCQTGIKWPCLDGGNDDNLPWKTHGSGGRSPYFPSARLNEEWSPYLVGGLEHGFYCSIIWVWVNTYRYIFSGMNIHLPAILMFTRGTRF